MADVFPMHRDPTLAKWLPQANAGRVKKAVTSALDYRGATDEAAVVSSIVDQMQVDEIELGEWAYLAKPWVRNQTVAASDLSAARLGLYPGDRYPTSYTVYRCPVVRGSKLVTVGVNGGHRLDPMFVSFNAGHIEVRAADDEHRDRQLDHIRQHVNAANDIVKRWNVTGLPTVVEGEFRRQHNQQRSADARAAELQKAGFAPAAVSKPRPLPLPDVRKNTSTVRRPKQPTSGVRFTLTAEQFRGVLEVVATHVDQVERQPGAGAPSTSGEDDHRDQLLHALNLVFCDASSESFSKLGKTDIRLIIDDDGYLYFECKIWSGPSAISDALEQLLEKYLIYRDNFGVIVMFIRDIADPTKLTPKALTHIEQRHDGVRVDDVAGFPVMRILVPDGDGRSVAVAVVMVVVDSAPKRP